MKLILFILFCVCLFKLFTAILIGWQASEMAAHRGCIEDPRHFHRALRIAGLSVLMFFFMLHA